ncbi:hypothetical protein mRhiFer1_008556 [Rhinolophus ferrumequinum]|uniref:Uncharacterized protein n=1 Tax=Rhinolophus ferrumequinum TaxID=59479 RepID=A0A7J7UJG6_RHIFE|nr:hypothetical protein mRhiFer1_008556 [Rhinolophus ferrumequinum]
MFPGSNLLGDPVSISLLGVSLFLHVTRVSVSICVSVSWLLKQGYYATYYATLQKCEEENINRQTALWKHRRLSSINKWLHPLYLLGQESSYQITLLWRDLVLLLPAHHRQLGKAITSMTIMNFTSQN